MSLPSSVTLHRLSRAIGRTAALAGLALALASPVGAQQPVGSITGQITTRSAAPISEAQVVIVGTQQGALTAANGRFLIHNVAPGTYQLQVIRIGYETQSQEVTVQAGQVAVANYVLADEALGLDEIVVTGTAGAARRREVGNSVVQISAAEVAAPPPSVDQLLQSRSPGLLVSQGNGNAGSGSQIRLRGAVSVSQSNQPIIYVDGIRVRSDAYRRNISPTEGAGRGGNVTASPLNDINPSDIDRIEVLKGSAASTLYGTEAAAGVIQIFTKRGTSGAPRWTMQIDQGFNHLLPFAPDVDVRPTNDPSLTTQPRGSYSYKYLNMDPYLRDGYRQKYSLSVAGGAQALQYFISGQYDGNQGVLPLDNEEKAGVRGNFTFTPTRDLTVQVSSAYNRDDIRNTPAGNNAQGLTLNAFRRERNYFSNGDPDTIRQVLVQKVTTRIDRFILGTTVSYQPSADFTNKVTVGYDEALQDNRQLRPYGYRQLPTGKLYTSQGNFSNLTVDLVSSYKYAMTANSSVTASVGGQSITEDTRIVQAEGTDFAGPGDPDIDAGANRLSWEQRVRVVTAGFFGQALFNFKDRYFITVGARVDGNSAFGKALGLQTYPKISGSYVISDEDFWNDAYGSLKLRAAWGQSGRAPGTFDAVRTWNAIGYGGQPSYLPDNLGNPNLGPERTGETELGFDWSGFDSRVSADFTWYQQKTTDALFAVQHPPSEGFATEQQENVGKIENKGIELNVNGVVFDRESWGLTLGANVYTNHTKVLSLGGSPPFSSDAGWIQEGQPVTLIRGVKIHNGDKLENPSAVCTPTTPADAVCVELDVPLGPQQPTKVFGGNVSLRMPYGVELSARGEYQGGHYIEDGPTNEGVNRNIRWPTCADYYAFTDNGMGDQAPAEMRYFCDSRFYRRGTMRHKADFFKLRDVTARIPLGTLVPGTANSTLTLSAQNWYRWRNSDFPIFDPEMVTNGGFGNQNPGITEHIPPAASFVASIRVVF